MTKNRTLAAALCAALATALALADGTSSVASHFPRTATAGQDGTAAHPFEIADEDDLRALAAAVADCPEARGLCYVQTADIALTAPWPGIGIPNGKDLVGSSDASKVAEFDAGAFCGVFDGWNHTVSGFQMVGVDELVKVVSGLRMVFVDMLYFVIGLFVDPGIEQINAEIPEHYAQYHHENARLRAFFGRNGVEPLEEFLPR